MAFPHRLLWNLALGSRSRPDPASAFCVTGCQKFLRKFKHCGRKRTSHPFSRSLARSLARALSLSFSDTHTHTRTHTQEASHIRDYPEVSMGQLEKLFVLVLREAFG